MGLRHPVWEYEWMSHHPFMCVTHTPVVLCEYSPVRSRCLTEKYSPVSATHCNTRQHAATHCNTLQCPATHCNIQQTRCLTLGVPLCIHMCGNSHDSYICVTRTPVRRRSRTSRVYHTHSYVWHDSWLIHTWDTTHDSFVHVTHTPVRRRSPSSSVCTLDTYKCVCMTWLVHTCSMTYLYVWHGSFICVI